MTALLLLAALVVDAAAGYLIGYVGTPWWGGLAILVAAAVAYIVYAAQMVRCRAPRVHDRTKVRP